jgi:hypothetical protein
VRVVARDTGIQEDECFALMALAEVPDQFMEAKEKRILKPKAGE